MNGTNACSGLAYREPGTFTPASTRRAVRRFPGSAFALLRDHPARPVSDSRFNGSRRRFRLIRDSLRADGAGDVFDALLGASQRAPQLCTRSPSGARYHDRGRLVGDHGAAVPADSLHEVFRCEKNDGSGDVIIQRRHWSDSESSNQATDLGFPARRKPPRSRTAAEASRRAGPQAGDLMLQRDCGCSATISARRIASRMPTGRMENTSSAILSRTTVGFLSPSIKWRPTTKLAGRHQASHKLDR